MRSPNRTPKQETVICEEPLSIRVEGTPLMTTMRTPGNDVELVTGLLFSEGIISDIDDISAIGHVDAPDQPQNSIETRLSAGTQVTTDAIRASQREIMTTSACGVCGAHAIDRLLTYASPNTEKQTVSHEIITKALKQMGKQQPMFDVTGGVHAAALATLEGEVFIVREDIGRHNAIDKVIGAVLQDDREILRGKILLTSGRAAFDTLQKALVAGVAVVVSRGAASSLAVSLAKQGNISLLGFYTAAGYNDYTPDESVK